MRPDRWTWLVIAAYAQLRLARQHLQPLLVECAWSAVRTSGRLRARYHRLVLRFGGYRNPAAKKRAGSRGTPGPGPATTPSRPC
jgi:hypothetical protein